MYKRHGDVILLESVGYHKNMYVVLWYATLSNKIKQPISNLQGLA